MEDMKLIGIEGFAEFATSITESESVTQSGFTLRKVNFSFPSGFSVLVTLDATKTWETKTSTQDWDSDSFAPDMSVAITRTRTTDEMNQIGSCMHDRIGNSKWSSGWKDDQYTKLPKEFPLWLFLDRERAEEFLKGNPFPKK